MAEPSRIRIAQVLEENGLTGPAFDVAELETLMVGWVLAAEELDRLLASAPPGDPTAFLPDWP